MLSRRLTARIHPATTNLCCQYRTKANSTTADGADAEPPPSAGPTALIAPRGSLHHHDMASFLAHARSTGLSETSTVYVGTHYEYTVIGSLARLGFSLTRTGRSSDLGIDLAGHWRVPSCGPGPPLRTILQCKASSRKLSPESARGLEGAFAGAPAGWRAEGAVLGLLVAGEAATKGVRDAMVRSRLPLGFVQVSREGRVKQLLWNRVAGDCGLQGMGVTLRHGVRSTEGAGDDAAQNDEDPDIALTWNGRALSEEQLRALDAPLDGGRRRGRPRKVRADAAGATP